MKVRLQVSYCGSQFAGYQRQKNGTAVQNCLEEVLSGIYQQPVQICASGRTDTGVHAHGQVVSFTTPDDRLAITDMPGVLTRKLPPGIAVTEARAAGAEFHPRYQARVRLYRYRIAVSPERILPPELQDRVWLPGVTVDPLRLERYLKPLQGVHDFTAFTATDDPSRTKHRELFSISVDEHQGQVIVSLYGNAFTRNMVRAIIGNAVYALRRQLPEDHLRGCIDAGDPLAAPHRAPGKGLCLEHVFYCALFGPRDYYR